MADSTNTNSADGFDAELGAEFAGFSESFPDAAANIDDMAEADAQAAAAAAEDIDAATDADTTASKKQKRGRNYVAAGPKYSQKKKAATSTNSDTSTDNDGNAGDADNDNSTTRTAQTIDLVREVKRFKRLNIHLGAPMEVITKRCIEDYFAHDYYEPGTDINDPAQRVVRDDAPQTTEELMTALLASCNEMIRMHNAAIRNWLKSRDEKPLGGEIYPMLKRFSQYDLVTIIKATAIIVNIAPADLSSPTDLDLLSYYDSDPTSRSYGTYVPSEIEIEALVQSYCYNITRKELDDVLASLKRTCTRVTRAKDKDLLAVNNGIYNYKTKELLPFNPKYVFVSKSQINYRKNPVNPVKVSDDGYEWNIEDWMLELTDGDHELTETIWQIIGATLRPYVSWNKSAWFYSETGNNGKGTLLEMMRNLCGPQTYASIPLADFGKEFMLEPLTRASAILVDENDVGTFIDKAANLKAIVTNDTITINRKYRSPIAYQFYGFMVQCLNEYPKVKDRSESFYRRQLFIPFNTCFTGKERRYIKDDYMSDTEVLEYVLWRVLEGMDDYYVLDEPEAARKVLDDYKISNDPVREFWTEMREEFVWDLLPNMFLYDLYKQWHSRNIAYSSPMGRNNFLKAIAHVIAADPDWAAPDNGQAKVRTGDKMSQPEPLIRNFNLTNWENESVPNKRDNAHWIPKHQATYNGYVRVNRTNADIAAQQDAAQQDAAVQNTDAQQPQPQQQQHNTATTQQQTQTPHAEPEAAPYAGQPSPIDTQPVTFDNDGNAYTDTPDAHAPAETDDAYIIADHPANTEYTKANPTVRRAVKENDKRKQVSTTTNNHETNPPASGSQPKPGAGADGSTDGGAASGAGGGGASTTPDGQG